MPSSIRIGIGLDLCNNTFCDLIYNIVLLAPSLGGLVLAEAKQPRIARPVIPQSGSRTGCLSIVRFILSTVNETVIGVDILRCNTL